MATILAVRVPTFTHFSAGLSESLSLSASLSPAFFWARAGPASRTMGRNRAASQPMMRRMALHLLRGERHYPDSTQSNLWRYARQEATRCADRETASRGPAHGSGA